MKPEIAIIQGHCKTRLIQDKRPLEMEDGETVSFMVHETTLLYQGELLFQDVTVIYCAPDFSVRALSANAGREIPWEVIADKLYTKWLEDRDAKK